MTTHIAQMHDADSDSMIAKVEALRDLIERSAAANELSTEIGPEVMEALESAGVFTIMAPKALGGMEASPLTVFDVLRKLSYFDGSTGWYCQAATTGVAVAGAQLGDSAVDAIFRSGGRQTCAGQAAPSGKAERVPGGYRISGRFSFGSGIPNASWIVGGYILHEGDRPKLRANGEPIMLIAVAPRSKVEILGNWNVLGLRGTGSYDFSVMDQIVHEDFVFDPAEARPRRGGALYRMGFLAIPALCHAAFGAGCARRILDEWALHARDKKRLAGGTLSEAETFRRELAMEHAALRSAEAYVRKIYEELFAAAESGDVPAQLELEAKLCASNMIAVGTRIAQKAFTSSATTGLRNGSMLQRCFRDMQAGNAHFLTGEQSFIDAGGELARLAPFGCT